MEGQAAANPAAHFDREPTHVENNEKTEIEREAVNSVLIDTEDDLAVEVGDLVRYVDMAKPNDILTVQITHGKDDFSNGIINQSRPLAQALLGAVVGDEVALHLAGSASKTFLIVEFKRTQP